jgi:thioredoxin-dependent peroxiredoxin
MGNRILAASLIGLGLFFSDPSFGAPKVGEPAPKFELKSHEGKAFRLSDQKGKITVLYFYPKAGTPGCTVQACAFRDKMEEFKKHKIEVFGVSTDKISALIGFHKEQKLNFPLLSDAEGRVTTLYGAKVPLVNLAKRWTFLIDQNLVIRDIRTQVDPANDPEEVLTRALALKK